MKPPRYVILYWHMGGTGDDPGWQVYAWTSTKQDAMVEFRSCMCGPQKVCFGPKGVVAFESSY